MHLTFVNYITDRKLFSYDLNSSSHSNAFLTFYHPKPFKVMMGFKIPTTAEGGRGFKFIVPLNAITTA